jgi:hypothetical protein
MAFMRHTNLLEQRYFLPQSTMNGGIRLVYPFFGLLVNLSPSLPLPLLRNKEVIKTDLVSEV